MHPMLEKIDRALAVEGMEPGHVIAGAPPAVCEELAMEDGVTPVAGRVFYRGVVIQSREGAAYSVRGDF